MAPQPLRILFATSEAHPLIKTGGLGDVSGSLPAALKKLRHDVRLILPNYRQVLFKTDDLRIVAKLELPGTPETVRLLETKLPNTPVKLWLVDSPHHFDRAGGPYTNGDGLDWPDNAQRYTVFAQTVVKSALNQLELDWQPDVVHCNDWQCGLIPALLAREKVRPATVFTIHNLAYQGVFSWSTYHSLSLPADLWSPDTMEFYGSFSFIKGGLVFADMLNTVSPTYAKEIRTPEFGYNLQGLLNHRADRLVGILNGADYGHWDPRRDKFMVTPYDAKSFHLKTENKRALQSAVGLPVAEKTPVIGFVGRLVEQKGFDLFLKAIHDIMRDDAQFVVLGTGDKQLELAIRQATGHYPQQLAAHIGYDEELAHHIEAGSDMFLMPSRFEPCGLNQIYSLRYGTVPIVRRTGGLNDTVIDADEKTLTAGTATGFCFDEPTPKALHHSLQRAIALYHQRPEMWRRLATSGMKLDFSWRRSAMEYVTLYQQALSHAKTNGP
jgi:starch synthase